MLDRPVLAAAEGKPKKDITSLVDAEDSIGAARNLAHALLMAAKAVPDRNAMNAIATVADRIITESDFALDHLEALKEQLK